MNLGEFARKRLGFASAALMAVALLATPQSGYAQATPRLDAQAENVAREDIPESQAAEPSTLDVAPGAGEVARLGPEWIKGQPALGGVNFQDQYSPNGEYALWMHNAILLPLITFICLLVLGLLLYVVVRFNRRRNTVPSRTAHNTVIEVVWTLVPVLVLVFIAIPSITLLARQYQAAPEDALTVKVTGYQWYWGYTYPDNGGFEVISNMLPPEQAIERGEPAILAVDNRLVVPAGEPIRIQTTGADVIHSFAIPSMWFKIDAVPGRLNERVLYIEEPGIYYGQCSELCGARHAYMPIAVEALPRPQFDAWVLAQGGTLGGPDLPTAPAPRQEPESSVSGAPGAGVPEPLEDPAAGPNSPTAPAPLSPPGVTAGPTA
ncbi:cytochrome c oxidase subunit II [Altericroceibacterium xinjiangense]|uniref:cytochrome c oxidase subunit II n=1 Tax=Altericroceibacterium xinjiangense TaxID=762261 RepID=UPI000F7F1378|nr:cytochrome c oxidase subunit II [Altericroceibacterium xinjiangense]